MGDGLKLCKDKRHRSSSSIAGCLVEGTRSERKIDVRASIPEVDDHFAVAEARCDNLQEKIDLVKLLKKKKKLKKRSTTRVADTPIINADHVPFITVRTQPKKKVSQQAARLRRLEPPANPTRGYLDSATVEQHDMLGHVRGYNRLYRQLQEQNKKKQPMVDQNCQSSMQRARHTHADGDGELNDIYYDLHQRSTVGVCGQGVQISTNDSSQEVACGEDNLDEYSDSELYDQPQNAYSRDTKRRLASLSSKKRPQGKGGVDASRAATRKTGSPQKTTSKSVEINSAQKNRRTNAGNQIIIDLSKAEERPVVELFNKSRDSPTRRWQAEQQPSSPKKKNKQGYQSQQCNVEQTEHLENAAISHTRNEKESARAARRARHRSRRYELPTVASQMKQAGTRCYYDVTNQTNIPFVVSKSTGPSHNIGVNIQQVLNGLKIQQPLYGIPLTIAHHMGLGHVPYTNSKSVNLPSLDDRAMNAIRLGQRLVRLPSYRCMSYSRMLSLYRQGDGMVPRFLRAISRPHYFYTSMYNLVSNREDFDGATSKGRACSQDAKASLAEYAGMYREYVRLERALGERPAPDLERRRDELARQLAAREGHVRKVVEEYHTSVEAENAGLRASASTGPDDTYRQSTFKLNCDEPHP